MISDTSRTITANEVKGLSGLAMMTSPRWGGTQFIWKTFESEYSQKELQWVVLKLCLGNYSALGPLERPFCTKRNFPYQIVSISLVSCLDTQCRCCDKALSNTAARQRQSSLVSSVSLLIVNVFSVKGHKYMALNCRLFVLCNRSCLYFSPTVVLLSEIVLW